jgi:hypothetical protein
VPGDGFRHTQERKQSQDIRTSGIRRSFCIIPAQEEHMSTADAAQHVLNMDVAQRELEEPIGNKIKADKIQEWALLEIAKMLNRIEFELKAVREMQETKRR